MRLYGVTGWKNSGKTVLVERLVAEITGRGLTVATLKHAHHGFDVDQPGKDSHRHRAAGASQVLVASGRRWALMTELRGGPEPCLDALVARLDPVDVHRQRVDPLFVDGEEVDDEVRGALRAVDGSVFPG